MGKKSKKKSSPRSAVAAAPSCGQPASTGSFSIGDRVLLGGLTTEKYNGKLGIVKSIPNANEERYGIVLDGMTAPLGIRPHNISLALTMAEAKTMTEAKRHESRKSTREQLEERRSYTSQVGPSEGCLNADQMEHMRTFRSMFITQEMEMKAYGRKIDPMPDFREEVLNQFRGLPFGVNTTWAKKYMRQSFEHAHPLPHIFELAFKSSTWTGEPRYIFKRLNSNNRAKLEWFFSNPGPGSIFPQRAVKPYSSLLRHSFSNQMYRKEVLHCATTHIAVGFVDLGMLFAAELQPHLMRQSNDPLRFVGIEMSAYAIAKAHVIWELLQMAPPPTASEWKLHLCIVLQVWFSSSWAEGTFETVKKALVTLCSQDSASYHSDVREILEYWLDAPKLSIIAARTQLMEFTTDSLSSIGSLVRKCDRIALARYELTRDFGLQGQQPLYGNTIMFDCPDGTPPLMVDETVFSALCWEDVMKLCMAHERSGMDIIEAAEQCALEGVMKLAKWARNESVVVELKCAAIQDIIQEVAEARPWTMSWSNILDYFDYSDFHRIARACSANGDTIHYAYSMNWSTETFGTSLLDFRGKERAQGRAEIIDQANQLVEQSYKVFGWDRYLRCPPPENPLNTTSQFLLENLYYHEWAEHFFDVGRRMGHINVGNIEHSVGSPLSVTGGSTVAFTWSYDPDIRFNMVQSPL